MIVRRLSEVPSIDWGNGYSRRFLLASDGMGFTLTDTLVRRGSTTRIEIACPVVLQPQLPAG